MFRGCGVGSVGKGLALQATGPEFYPKNLHKHTCNPSAGKVEAGIFLVSQASLLE